MHRKGIFMGKDSFVMCNEEGTDPYENIANAVILQACIDYRRVYGNYLRDGDASKLNELERFFHSNWYKKLTDLDGEYLMRRLREEVESKMCYKKYLVRK